MAEPLGIALLGCGTVGSGVARLLLEHSERLSKRAGRRLELHHIVVRHPNKPREYKLPRGLLTGKITDVLFDPKVNVIVELVGGTHWAKDALKAALAGGKDVVTANKAILARYGDEVFSTARMFGRSIAFEASVMGGVPIISTITTGLSANQITSIKGILNGTCNFILTEMTEKNRDYAAALTEAQRLGYAEADPTLDVDGSDTADKLAILCRLAFGVSIHPQQIERRGIERVTTQELNLARKDGFAIKLLAEADFKDGNLNVRVGPTRVPCESALAQVRGANNAAEILSDAAGCTFISGSGAGSMPTASAVVADLIDMAIGRAQLTFAALK